MNEFFLMSSFSSPLPACQLTYFLLIHQQHGERWRERGREWEGERMDGERKKVCFSIKRLSWRLGGIHSLFYVLFDDAFLFYELNDTQQQQKRISLLLCLPFLPSVSLCSFSRLNSLLLLIISSLPCILPSLL